jgi:hypothetical protein
VRASRLFHDPAGPALAHLEDAAQMRHGFTAALRAYHFPRLISLSISISRVCSATSFLSRAFSFSSSLSRLTVSVFAPLYSLFQRC